MKGIWKVKEIEKDVGSDLEAMDQFGIISELIRLNLNGGFIKKWKIL